MSSARSLAFEILDHAAQNRQTLDYWLDHYQVRIERLNRADRALLHALTYGVLRWQGRLDWIIDQLAVKPGKKLDGRVRIALRLGLFQLLYMERIPASAAVHTTVQLVKNNQRSWACGFVNSLLRNVSEKRQPITLPSDGQTPYDAMSVRHSFPLWLIKKWTDRLGVRETNALCETINTIPAIVLRTNTLRIQREDLIQRIKDQAQEVYPARYSPDGIVVRSPHASLAKWPAYRSGFFQVQGEASQLVTRMLDLSPTQTVWDACAGLGTKTAHIAQQLRNTGVILASDFSARKLDRLEQEMRRLGVSIVNTIGLDLNRPETLTTLPLFDRILLDAPCSGLGVLQKNPDGKWLVQQNDLNRLQATQYAILKNVAAHLKPGGTLVYAVCSMEPEETTIQIINFLNENKNFAIVQPNSKKLVGMETLVTPEGFLTTQPHHHQLDGFFAVSLQKSLLDV